MSTPRTGEETAAALAAAGLTVASTGTLRDVDTLDDAERVARAAPGGAFAAAWARRDAR
jgi:hypothetical protein